MAEARKVFPMNTFVSYLKGVDAAGQRKNVVELVGYMTDVNLDEEFAPFAAAMAKAWIYEQHPELVKKSAQEVSSMGDNVSVPALPADEKAKVSSLLAKLNDYKATIDATTAKLAKVEAELAEKSAILVDAEARAKAAEAKAAQLEASMKPEGEKVIVASEAKVTEYIGKVAELLKMIEDVKKHGVVTVAAGGAAGAAPAGEAAAGAPASGEPTPDFGFGGDPFADSNW